MAGYSFNSPLLFPPEPGKALTPLLKIGKPLILPLSSQMTKHGVSSDSGFSISLGKRILCSVFVFTAMKAISVLVALPHPRNWEMAE